MLGGCDAWGHGWINGEWWWSVDVSSFLCNLFKCYKQDRCWTLVRKCGGTQNRGYLRIYHLLCSATCRCGSAGSLLRHLNVQGPYTPYSGRNFRMVSDWVISESWRPKKHFKYHCQWFSWLLKMMIDLFGNYDYSFSVFQGYHFYKHWSLKWNRTAFDNFEKLLKGGNKLKWEVIQ